MRPGSAFAAAAAVLRRAAALSALLALGALAGASGCASSSTMTIRIAPAPETNDGLPFYAVVRTVEQAAYVTDTYDAVASRVFANPADPSVVRTEVIYPGVEKEIEVEKPKALPLGIYFLFTNPGERWKTSVRQPVPDSVEIELAKNEIQNES